MTNDEEYASGDEMSWVSLADGEEDDKTCCGNKQRSKQLRKKDTIVLLSHLENGRTVLRQLPDHRWLWRGLVAVVVRRRHVAVVCVVVAAGVVVPSFACSANPNNLQIRQRVYLL